jgi:hypothetical protein
MPHKQKQEQEQEITPQQPARTPDITNKRPASSLGFDDWWARYAATRPAIRHLKTAVATHLKARGFWQRGDWGNGVKDFGLLS